MARDQLERRRRAKLVWAVLAVSIVASALVAVGLVYMEQMHARF
jgi:1,2-phenylacetyl-CoA epoxidase PaaB subunit